MLFGGNTWRKVAAVFCLFSRFGSRFVDDHTTATAARSNRLNEMFVFAMKTPRELEMAPDLRKLPVSIPLGILFHY